MIVLDNNRILQLIKNTALWTQFPYFKTLATRVSKASSAKPATGCSSCAARKAARNSNKLNDSVAEAKAYIVRLTPEKKAELKKAMNTDHFRLSVTDKEGKLSDYVY